MLYTTDTSAYRRPYQTHTLKEKAGVKVQPDQRASWFTAYARPIETHALTSK